jgi:hypothetical protein
MGGHPDWFKITNLEVLEPDAATGSEMKDVITVETGAAVGDAFDLLVTFRAEPNTDAWWQLAEWVGDPDYLDAELEAKATFFVESIGPGPERELGTESVRLQMGGNLGPDPANPSTSNYDIRFKVANADTAFAWWSAGEPQQGIFQFTCRVDVNAGPKFASAYYDEFLSVLVREGLWP